MAKYLVLWEIDTSRLPIDPKERYTAMGAMLDKDKQDIKDGIIKDWGCFFGELRGYTIHEVASEMELEEYLYEFVPFATLKVYRVMSLEHCTEICAAALQNP